VAPKLEEKLPPALAALQGEWIFVPSTPDGKPIENKDGRFDKIIYRFQLEGKKLTWKGAKSSYDELMDRVRVDVEWPTGGTIYAGLRKNYRERGNQVEYDIDTPNQIMISITGFGLVGLYRLDENKQKLELLLKYIGQGVEGEYAKQWRPPSGFDKPQSEDCARILLHRVENKDETPATPRGVAR